MRRTASLACLLLAAAPAAAVAGTLDTPIIGGTATTVGQYPNVVAIEVGQGLCTGILIHPEWILTAAHCVTPSVVGAASQTALTQSIKVHFNTINIGQKPGAVVTAVDSIPDTGFNINSLGHSDAGLIHLAKPVTDVMPAPVNFIASRAPVGTTVVMVGFGTTQIGAQGGAGVEYALSNRTSVACSSFGQQGMTDDNLLCFSQTDSKGKCEGDSGGPSFAMINGALTVVGVTSFGDQQCAQFGADTRTDAEKKFITSHVPNIECAGDADCADGHECFQHTCIVTPFQPTGLGSTCTANGDCDSGSCAMQGSDGKCTSACTVADATTCPAGFDCMAAGGGQGACWPASNGGGGGCCDAGSAGAPGSLLLALGLGAVLVRRRRR